MEDKKIIIFSTTSHAFSIVKAALCYSAADVVRCSTCKAMMEMCQALRPDLIIILSVAPFVGGELFIEQLRQICGTSSTIYVIAWHQSESAVMGFMESGADQYMTFPISLMRLHNKAITHLRNNHI
jgi:DNA-binding response OmpR family regulator